MKKLTVTLTEEEELLLDVWLQDSIEGKNKRRYGTVSAVEDVGYYLQQHGLINSWGNPTKKSGRKI